MRHPLETKQCRQCGATFTTAGNHARCVRCIAHRLHPCRYCGKDFMGHYAQQWCGECEKGEKAPIGPAPPEKRGFIKIREADGMAYWKNPATGQYIGSRGPGQPECEATECPICHHHASQEPEIYGYCSKKCKDEMMAALTKAAMRVGREMP